jgi:hypothetical protein
VIHSEGRVDGVKLIERCFRALVERGMLLIWEFVPNDDRTGPAIPVLFGLNMLLHTPVGDDTRRRLVRIAVTERPSAEWSGRQLTKAFLWGEVPHHLIRDGDFRQEAAQLLSRYSRPFRQ